MGIIGMLGAAHGSASIVLCCCGSQTRGPERGLCSSAHSDHFRLQSFDLFLNLSGDPALGQIDLGNGHIQCVSHFRSRTLSEHVQIKDPEMPRVDPRFDALDGGGQEILLPLLIPLGVVDQAGRVGHLVFGGSVPRLLAASFAEGLRAAAFPELIRDSPSSQLKQPAFERSECRIVLEIAHLLGWIERGRCVLFKLFTEGTTG
jgi:hypothetical protein